MPPLPCRKSPCAPRPLRQMTKRSVGSNRRCPCTRAQIVENSLLVAAITVPLTIAVKSAHRLSTGNADETVAAIGMAIDVFSGCRAPMRKFRAEAIGDLAAPSLDCRTDAHRARGLHKERFRPARWPGLRRGVDRRRSREAVVRRPRGAAALGRLAAADYRHPPEVLRRGHLRRLRRDRNRDGHHRDKTALYSDFRAAARRSDLQAAAPHSRRRHDRRPDRRRCRPQARPDRRCRDCPARRRARTGTCRPRRPDYRDQPPPDLTRRLARSAATASVIMKGRRAMQYLRGKTSLRKEPLARWQPSIGYLSGR